MILHNPFQMETQQSNPNPSLILTTILSQTQTQVTIIPATNPNKIPKANGLTSPPEATTTAYPIAAPIGSDTPDRRAHKKDL
mmetsp:Transcript_20150/g.31984  ORF Transcript_20150/g.31984 Transcript_20150/m.31984 type:complete len:82 (-) Transcript_20150:817-1062(-)